MTTTIHIPSELLALVDARAKTLGMSRNRVILQAIEGTLAAKSTWSPELLAMLATPLDAATGDLLAATLRDVRRRRANRRAPPKF